MQDAYVRAFHASGPVCRTRRILDLVDAHCQSMKRSAVCARAIAIRNCNWKTTHWMENLI